MSLDWDCSKVKNFKQKLKNNRLKAVIDILIWATMYIGIRRITEKNVKQFFARLCAYEAVNGAFLYKNGKPKPITFSEVEKFIGLTTNANEMTASQFERTKIMKGLL